MNEKRKRLPKTTKAQYEELLQFVMANRILVTGKATQASEMKIVCQTWQQFAQHINSLVIGPSKTAKQWRQVFKEWRQNTKRKSRRILENVNTRGGPCNSRILTHLEQQLLNISSTIHLGEIDPLALPLEVSTNGISSDDDVKDFVTTESAPQFLTKEPTITNKYSCNNRTPLTEKIVEMATSYSQVINSREQLYTKTPASVCEDNSDTQQRLVDSAKLKAESIGQLAAAIKKFADSYKEVQKERTKLELKKLKMEYYKCFGTVEGFDEF